MNRELRDRWTAAMRSGEYKQGIGRLRTTDNDSSRYCCLGVLCVVAGLKIDDVADGVVFEGAFQGYHPIKNTIDQPGQFDQLWRMNDIQRMSFDQIADWIELNIRTAPASV